MKIEIPKLMKIKLFAVKKVLKSVRINEVNINVKDRILTVK